MGENRALVKEVHPANFLRAGDIVFAEGRGAEEQHYEAHMGVVIGQGLWLAEFRREREDVQEPWAVYRDAFNVNEHKGYRTLGNPCFGLTLIETTNERRFIGRYLYRPRNELTRIVGLWDVAGLREVVRNFQFARKVGGYGARRVQDVLTELEVLLSFVSPSPLLQMDAREQALMKIWEKALPRDKNWRPKSFSESKKKPLVCECGANPFDTRCLCCLDREMKP